MSSKINITLLMGIRNNPITCKAENSGKIFYNLQIIKKNRMILKPSHLYNEMTIRNEVKKRTSLSIHTAIWDTKASQPACTTSGQACEEFSK